MDAVKNESICPVCGFQLDQPAWSDLGGASDVICPSCGIQFGYNDAAGGDAIQRQKIYRDWQRKWIEGGMKWHSAADRDPPAGWNPIKQLERVQKQS